jgi:hypothetical protein
MDSYLKSSLPNSPSFDRLLCANVGIEDGVLFKTGSIEPMWRLPDHLPENLEKYRGHLTENPQGKFVIQPKIKELFHEFIQMHRR